MVAIRPLDLKVFQGDAQQLFAGMMRRIDGLDMVRNGHLLPGVFLTSLAGGADLYGQCCTLSRVMGALDGWISSV